MLLAEERELIVEYGKKLVASGLTTGTGGNLSIKNQEQGLIAVSPSGLDYFETRPHDVAVVDLTGNVVEGERSPSSETGFHLALYGRRPDALAVVHTHSVYATTLACLNWELPAVHYMVAFSGDKVPLAPYATFGTDELAKNVGEAIGGHNAVLLANHGLVTIGNNLPTAFAAAEEIELVARIYIQAKSVGDPVILSRRQMEPVMEKFRSYGQK